MKTNRGFDFLAPIYDQMARLVFGKAIVDAQTVFLNAIPAESKVLILGGGTGWILEKIDEQNKSCKICYVELSVKMMEKARQRKSKDEIYFIQGTEQDIPEDLTFDVIITNFYLDLFTNEKLMEILDRLHSVSKPQSIWLITDFTENSWWNRWMLTFMYSFFRTTCGIEGSRLPHWDSRLQMLGWRESDTKLQFKSFIKSSVWAHG